LIWKTVDSNDLIDRRDSSELSEFM